MANLEFQNLELDRYNYSAEHDDPSENALVDFSYLERIHLRQRKLVTVALTGQSFRQWFRQEDLSWLEPYQKEGFDLYPSTFSKRLQVAVEPSLLLTDRGGETRQQEDRYLKNCEDELRTDPELRNVWVVRGTFADYAELISQLVFQGTLQHGSDFYIRTATTIHPTLSIRTKTKQFVGENVLVEMGH